MIDNSLKLIQMELELERRDDQASTTTTMEEQTTSTSNRSDTQEAQDKPETEPPSNSTSITAETSMTSIAVDDEEKQVDIKEDPDAEELDTSQDQDQSKRKRQYSKKLHDDGLSGKYWQSTTPGAAESSRPKRSNAGSLMKTALQEIDSKKKRASACAAPATPPTPSPAKTPTKYFRVKEEDTKVKPLNITSRRSIRKEEDLPPVLTPEKPTPTHRGRGRPRKDSTVVGSSDNKDKTPAKEEKNVTPTPIIRTYGRRRSTVKPELVEEEPPKLPPIIRTYTRRSRTVRQECAEAEEPSNAAPSCVSPSLALMSALSIPDKILPTSHEKFLDKFRETQEKSPTPPERRVPNLDEVVATYKSKTGEEQASDSESDSSESSTSTDDQKENVPSSSASSIISKAEGTLKANKFEEEDKPIPVVKLGNNQLLINNEIVDVNYTEYVKEGDVEVPFDYDVLFQPEPPMENPLPIDDALPSQPSSPPPPAETNISEEEEIPCKLERCGKGCVCSSLKEAPPLREHCGKAKCFIECSCLFKDQLHINADDKNIRARLRPRVTLLNWKHLSRNGNAAEQNESGNNEKPRRKSKKNKAGRKRRGEASSAALGEPSPKRLRGRVPTRQVVTPVKGKLATQQPLPYSKPGPMSSKPRSIMLLQKALPRQVPIPVIRKPTLISTRYPSNHPLLRRLYSCQPCHVKLTKMPKKWSHWKVVESHCGTGRVERKQQQVPTYQQAKSNFRVAAQADLSYTIVRPGGSILAMLYWEAHTKVAPRSHLPPPNPSRPDVLPVYPWLYLPLPSSGKVWLFFEIPKYPKDVPSVWLPEIGIFLPTDKLMLMSFEASKTGKTCKLYFESEDEAKLGDQGLPTFVYLVPHLPSLIVYGPAPKACLKSTSRKCTDIVINKFDEAQMAEKVLSEDLKKQLDAAGTDVDVLESDEEDPVEYQDNIDRSGELIDPQIFEQVYKNFMIRLSGDSDESFSEISDQDYDEFWEEFEHEEKKENSQIGLSPPTGYLSQGLTA